MKDYIDERQIDYIRYLDMQQGVVTEKLEKFGHMTDSYDNVVNDLCRLEEERDLVRAKLEIAGKQNVDNQFVVLTGTCFRKDRYIIEKLLFRRTHGHSYIVFKDRDSENNRDMFICFVNKGVYKNISTRLNTLF